MSIRSGGSSGRGHTSMTGSAGNGGRREARKGPRPPGRFTPPEGQTAPLAGRLVCPARRPVWPDRHSVCPARCSGCPDNRSVYPAKCSVCPAGRLVYPARDCFGGRSSLLRGRRRSFRGGGRARRPSGLKNGGKIPMMVDGGGYGGSIPGTGTASFPFFLANPPPCGNCTAPLRG
jgi:hypothetical protein